MPAAHIASLLMDHQVNLYGVPEQVLTDNGTQSISSVFKALCTILGKKHPTTTAYHPQTNEQAKQFNKTIIARLGYYVAEHQRAW